MPTPDLNVDFLIIGAAKCATTWLQQSLSANKSLYLPEPELHFFSREYDRGIAWYQDQFSGFGRDVTIGEKSNSYLTESQAADRIAKHYPDVRLIAQLRDPVKRAYSDYCMLLRRGSVSTDIWRHLDPEKAADERFLVDSRYGHHLTRFRDTFPEENLLILDFDDVTREPEKQLRRVADHLGVKGALHPPVQERVKDKNAPTVPHRFRRALAPLRPMLDPLRDKWPVRAIRDQIARPVKYPPLHPDLAKKMRDHFLPDIELLQKFEPTISAHWLGER